MDGWVSIVDGWMDGHFGVMGGHSFHLDDRWQVRGCFVGSGWYGFIGLVGSTWQWSVGGKLGGWDAWLCGCGWGSIMGVQESDFFLCWPGEYLGINHVPSTLLYCIALCKWEDIAHPGLKI